MDEPQKRVLKKWIRNAADRLAVKHGARFDPGRGEHFLEVSQSHFRLYEGSRFAGQLVEWQDWQVDFWMRLFSWVVWSDFLDRWVRRFRRARLWVPKKNGKSPMAAACGLYLTVADGELGGKTYSAALDKAQAAIVHDHAVKMVEFSPELLAECTVNYTNKRITHTPTLSWYGVISGEHDSNEGLNGNTIIDEGHVVDSRLADSLKYAGISREEPLELMVSTAGDNLAGWGKQQWDYGGQVNRGDVEDIRFLHVCYAAPQDATDSRLAANRKLWKAANPSLGALIDPEEFEQELKAARQSPSAWIKYKKYRFNIWQSTSFPWISADHWARCRADDAKLPLLVGKDAYLGLDMSVSRDMTGINLIVPVPREGYEGHEDEPEAKVYYQLPHFWITRAAVDRWKHLVPMYEDWSARGFLTIHEDQQLHFHGIRDDILKFALPYNVICITFDKLYATDTSQLLAEKIGCELVEFRQTLTEYAEPTQMYERLLKLRLLRHFDHPVLNWMAGHIEVSKPDRSGNYRPVKPRVDGVEGSRESHKAIDGIVAGVMALRDAVHYRPVVHRYYEEHEVEAG